MVKIVKDEKANKFMFVGKGGKILTHEEGILLLKETLQLTSRELAGRVYSSPRTVEGWCTGRPIGITSMRLLHQTFNTERRNVKKKKT